MFFLFSGTRRYAEAVVEVIDKDHVYFNKRIVSRTDSKSDGHDKSLERIFLGDPSMAVSEALCFCCCLNVFIQSVVKYFQQCACAHYKLCVVHR